MYPLAYGRPRVSQELLEHGYWKYKRLEVKAMPPQPYWDHYIRCAPRASRPLGRRDREGPPDEPRGVWRRWAGFGDGRGLRLPDTRLQSFEGAWPVFRRGGLGGGVSGRKNRPYEMHNAPPLSTGKVPWSRDAVKGREVPPLPSRAPSPCPATVPLTASGFNGICNRQ